MKIKAFPLMLAAMISAPALASCRTELNQKWLYTKADMAEFAEYQGDVETIDGITTFKVISGDPIFDKEVKKENLRVFDLKAALQDLSKKDETGYLSYRTIEKHLMPIKEFKVNEDLTEFQVNIKADNDKTIAVLINKDVTNNSNYHAICIPHVNKEIVTQPNPQVDFEESYISGSWSYAEGGKFAIQVISNIGSIVAGAAFNSPTAIVGGIFGILGAVGEQFCASGPTIKDVMNKLNEMDEKLDAIGEKLDQNHNQLMQEEIRTQAAVDKSILQTLESQMTSFTTDYIVPLDNFERDFADYIEQSYKTYTKSSETINMYLTKGEYGKWSPVMIKDEIPGSQELLSIAINNFDNSQEFLNKHRNIVEEGFVDEFNKDIDQAISTTELPVGLSEEEARYFAHANIIEQFTKKYYEDNHQKALDLKNMAINYSKRISGRLSVSIINTYLNRLQYMYNFSGEMKVARIDLLSNILGSLDRYAAIAGLACMYAETNNKELVDEYKLAREFIQNTYKNIKEVPDTYNFVTNQVMEGNFYQAKYKTSYNGNNLSAKLDYKKVEGYQATYKDDDITKHDYVNATEHLKIAARWNLMREIGLSSSATYVDYLNDASVINDKAVEAYQALLAKKYIEVDCYRIMTGYTTRSLNDSDKSLIMTCQAQADRDSDYFHVDNQYTFRGGHSSSCWSGTMIETTYIDGNNGTISNDKKVAAYARYAESHWYWSTDEYWSFVDNPYGNYFFALEVIS
ncbi:MAG: hypothetical protein HUJ59_01830 [Bacilli bacterium]|nr:hypothetical protein [Bacilli bacterium]